MNEAQIERRQATYRRREVIEYYQENVPDEAEILLIGVSREQWRMERCSALAL
jgi:hypothetical protein